MKTLQVVEGAEDGDLQRGSTDWAAMVSLPRLKLPRSNYGRIGTIQQEAEEREPSTSCLSQISLSEDEEASPLSIRAEVINFKAAINAPGALMTDCSLDGSSSSSSSCETPKGPTYDIPEPLTPPSPPRKRRALSGNRTRCRHGATSAFFQPANDDFELLFCPLASHVM